MSAAAYAVLADLTLALHTAFVLFVVVGQGLVCAGWALQWSWTRGRGFRLLHLAAIAYVALEAWLGVDCPLTVLENRLRERAGTGPYAESFIGHWLQEILFYSAPPWVFTLIYSGFALLVALTFILYPPQSFSKRHFSKGHSSKGAASKAVGRHRQTL